MASVIQEAQELPNGARFYLCALQVNPYSYLVRHRLPVEHPNEAAYNAALVSALVGAGIEVIAVTDHYRVKTAATLIAAAEAAGIVVFKGFEAATKDGIHLLCLFDPETSIDDVQSRIHGCGVTQDNVLSPLGDKTAEEMFQRCREWKMQCIGAHVTHKNGLLTVPTGLVKARIWRHEDLMAVAIPGAVDTLPVEHRRVLANEDPNFKRDRRVAILNCGDLSSVAHAAEVGKSCRIKMTRPTLEGLRQAFLDPDSRVRLASQPKPEDHIEFLSMAWESAGFLRDLKLHFNENMNVLIGGRGTGKSTVIESLRYVLDLKPLGSDASATHMSIVQNVLKSGTKISLAVRSYRPDRRTFLIERAVGNPAIVRDFETGNVLKLKPSDVVPRAAIYGQNEITEVARNPTRLTELLDQFAVVDDVQDETYADTKRKLGLSRRDILQLQNRIADIDEQLAALPRLEETLKRYKDSGVEEKLKDQALIVREEALVRSVSERVEPFRSIGIDLRALLPIERADLAEEVVKDLSSMTQLRALDAGLAGLAQEAGRAADIIDLAVKAMDDRGIAASAAVAARKAATQSAYQKILRELQTEKNIDGVEFMRIRGLIERLKPLSQEKVTASTELAETSQRRRNELAAWEELKREKFERLGQAAKRIGRQLRGNVRVRVTYAGDRQPLYELLKSKPGGRLSETVAALTAHSDLSVAALAHALAENAGRLTVDFGVPAAQAARLTSAGPELPMLIEELDLAATTHVELNISADGAEAEWRDLKDLSTGQKASALLYLLLIESDVPLVVDQLEDNLDNRFISEGIVPKIKSEKQRRQFIFASHNANIPVLGDAELILAFSATGEAGDGHIEITPDRMGSIDAPEVARLVKEVLEGGREAFTSRRLKYGF
jgi:ABC-type lipoprotein export system ATPase subunit